MLQPANNDSWVDLVLFGKGFKRGEIPIKIGRNGSIVLFGQQKISSKSIGLFLLCNARVILLIRRAFCREVFIIQKNLALAVEKQMCCFVKKGKPKVIMRLKAIGELDHRHLSGNPTRYTRYRNVWQTFHKNQGYPSFRAANLKLGESLQVFLLSNFPGKVKCFPEQYLVENT